MRFNLSTTSVFLFTVVISLPAVLAVPAPMLSQMPSIPPNDGRAGLSRVVGANRILSRGRLRPDSPWVAPPNEIVYTGRVEELSKDEQKARKNNPDSDARRSASIAENNARVLARLKEEKEAAKKADKASRKAAQEAAKAARKADKEADKAAR